MNLGPINPLAPVSQRTLAEEAADRLRSAIRSGALPPHTRLVERELATSLGVSRIPVREAIHQLVEEGLVKKIPHRGTFVYTPSQHELEEIASLRVALEAFVLERVIARWQPQHDMQLRQIVEDMRQAAAEDNRQRVFELDNQFHYVLWQIADHNILLELVSGLRSRISRFLYEATLLLQPSGLEEHVNGHEELVDLLHKGDAAAVKETSARHILGAKERILTYFEQSDRAA
jgi:DNA-binding GntR family transcriptional regulator